VRLIAAELQQRCSPWQAQIARRMLASAAMAVAPAATAAEAAAPATTAAEAAVDLDELRGMSSLLAGASASAAPFSGNVG
jgi:hypothetical protein